MNDYDFSTLNDKEFANLTIDLISRDRAKQFERFKADSDGGINGIFLCREKNNKVGKYAFSRTLSPTVITNYDTELIPKELLERKVEGILRLYEGF